MTILQKLPRRHNPKQKPRTRRRQIKRHNLSLIAPHRIGYGGSIAEQIIGGGCGADHEIDVRAFESRHGERVSGGVDSECAERFGLDLSLASVDGHHDGAVFFFFGAVVLDWIAGQLGDVRHVLGSVVHEDVPLFDAGAALDPFVGGVVDGFEVEVGEDGLGGAGSDAYGADVEAASGGGEGGTGAGASEGWRP